jgi:hypothetical protein
MQKVALRIKDFYLATILIPACLSFMSKCSKFAFSLQK